MKAIFVLTVFLSLTSIEEKSPNVDANLGIHIQNEILDDIWHEPLFNRVPIYRFYSSKSDKHFWTADPDGEVLSSDYLEEGVAFYGLKSGGIPVYRFYSESKDKHFWTTDSDGELLTDDFKKEGIAFRAPKNGIPVYRFYNENRDKHFWTASPNKELLSSDYIREATVFYSAETCKGNYRVLKSTAFIRIRNTHPTRPISVGLKRAGEIYPKWFTVKVNDEIQTDIRSDGIVYDSCRWPE